jgi:hypothetical protein
MYHKKTSILLLSSSLILALATTSIADAAPKKDRDAERVRARRAATGKVIKDKVGQGDLRDWRFVEVGKSATLEVLVDFKPLETKIELVVTDASGKVLIKELKGRGVRKVSLEVTPGIYYVMVEAKQSPRTEYQITLKVK